MRATIPLAQALTPNPKDHFISVCNFSMFQEGATRRYGPRQAERVHGAWAQVDHEGFATEVFRPRIEWGESPCVVEIHPDRPELMLEVSVPDVPGARVRAPLRAEGTSWNIDDSARASAFFDAAVEQRTKELEVREMRGEQRAAGRLRAELTWLERLRAAPDPVLEPADDGEEAR